MDVILNPKRNSEKIIEYRIHSFLLCTNICSEGVALILLSGLSLIGFEAFPDERNNSLMLN